MMSDRSDAAQQGLSHGYEDGVNGRLAVPRQEIGMGWFDASLSTAYAEGYRAGYDAGKNERAREQALKQRPSHQNVWAREK